jgi:hypothetical protein
MSGGQTGGQMGGYGAKPMSTGASYNNSGDVYSRMSEGGGRPNFGQPMQSGQGMPSWLQGLLGQYGGGSPYQRPGGIGMGIRNQWSNPQWQPQPVAPPQQLPPIGPSPATTAQQLQQAQQQLQNAQQQIQTFNQPWVNSGNADTGSANW